MGALLLCHAALLRSTSAPFGGASPHYNGSPHGAAGAGRWRPEPRLSAGRESPARSQPGASDVGEPHSNGGGGDGGSLPSSPRRMMTGRPAPLERGELPAAGRAYERLPAPPPLPEGPASRGGSPVRSCDGPAPKESGLTPSSSGLGPTTFRGIGQLAGAAPRASAEPAGGVTSALPPPPAISQPPVMPNVGGNLAATSAAQPKGLLSTVLDMDSCHSADLSLLSQVCLLLECMFAPYSPSSVHTVGHIVVSTFRTLRLHSDIIS